MSGLHQVVRRRELAGILLFAAIVQFAFLANIGQILYEGYSLKDTLLSDLGVWEQPSALLFNTSLVMFGILGIGVGVVLWPDKKLNFIPLLFVLCGIGMLIMAAFPITIEWAHDVGAFLSFVLIAVAALCCFWTFPGPFGYASLFLGLIGFFTEITYKTETYFGLGAAGSERMIVYPLFFWMAAFAAVLFYSDENAPRDSLLDRFFGWVAGKF
ncbi:MAG: hypothetical protein A4E30_01223 [Methanomassiliicoccales archaeon PtaB.Bin215]|nr:MAG: hypothetical protein A4E30_01223 [Methanomassiliicoccales archaeon PtaB.Bin215]